MSNAFTPELVFVSDFELGETDPRFHGSRQFGSDHVMILIPPHLGPMTNLRSPRMGIFRWAQEMDAENSIAPRGKRYSGWWWWVGGEAAIFVRSRDHQPNPAIFFSNL